MTAQTAAARLFQCTACGATTRIDEADLSALVVIVPAIVCGQPVNQTRIACRACGDLMGTGAGKPLKVTVSASKACDSRCTMATGASCTCACGGHNHGADYRTV